MPPPNVTPVIPPSSDGSSGDLMPAPEPMLKDGETPAIDPAKDKEKLTQQGNVGPTSDGTIGSRPTDVFSEDWWAHTRPILEMHGYFRTRAELFHNFALSRHDGSGTSDNPGLWAHPLDHTYTDKTGARRQVLLCGDPDAAGRYKECFDKTQAHANLRLRLNPEIHISDNLRILTQIDLLDNLVLGSTPDSYALKPTGIGSSGYNAALPNGYAALNAFSNNQGPPTAGVNGYKNSIEVKRAWAEYLTPLGQVRIGRMPAHWGLGMLLNSGDCIDCDYQTNVDRIMFTSGLKSLDLYFGGSWNFVSSGPTNQSPYDVYGGQPYNTANLTNVHEWMLFAAHRTNPELQRLKLSRGDFVINGGLYTMYRKQILDVVAGNSPFSANDSTPNNGLERRGMGALMPDAWVQFLFNKFRFESEFAAILGDIDSSPYGGSVNNPKKVRMWGLATQAEFRAVEDKLRIQFGHGWASGDPNSDTLTSPNSFATRQSDGAISTFRFHPAYYVDYIFFRRIMSRVQGAYYFRPSVEYDFLRNPNGQKFGGGAAIIWSRASEFIQTPGNRRDLGVELDVQLYYQSKDGSLNDDPTKMGGFYTALQYGVFFPLPGLEYLKSETADTSKLSDWSLSTAQTVRLIVGVLF